MILANYAQENRNAVRYLGIAYTNPLAMFRPTLLASESVADTADVVLRRSALPHGYAPPYSYALPISSGGIASTLQIRGSGSAGGTALAVKLALADLTGSGDLDGVGSLIVQALAALTGSGDISDADLKAFLQAVAALTGSGDADGTLTGYGAALAALTGSGTAATSIATGIGELDADLLVTGTGLNTANVGQAVWSYLIEAGFTADQVLQIIAAVAAGKSSGGPGSPVFRNLGDTRDVVTGTANSSGDRSAATYNPE